MPSQDEGLPAGYGSDTSAARACAGASGGAPSVLRPAESDQRLTPPEAYMQVPQESTAFDLNTCRGLHGLHSSWSPTLFQALQTAVRSLLGAGGRGGSPGRRGPERRAHVTEFPGGCAGCCGCDGCCGPRDRRRNAVRTPTPGSPWYRLQSVSHPAASMCHIVAIKLAP